MSCRGHPSAFLLEGIHAKSRSGNRAVYIGGGSVSGGSAGGFNLGNAYGVVIIDVSGVGAAMKRAQSDIQSGLSGIGNKIGSAVTDIGDKIESIGKSITGIGTKMAAIGAPVAAGFVAATKQAVDFDESITNIAAVLNLSQEEAKKLGDELQNAGANSRAGAQQVAQAYYDIAGGVADASTHMAILQAAIKTSEAGNSNLAGTTSALISVMNSYNLTAEQAGMVSDVLTRTVGMGVGTMDQFAAAFPSVTGVANSLGISFENLGQMMAYLTTKGNTASEASVQLSSLMVAMLKPNTDMADALKELGFQSGEAAVQQLGLVGAYQAINKTQKATAVGMGQLIGRVEGIRAVTSFGSKDVDSFFKKFTDGVKSATDAAQKIQNQSMAAKWDILNSRIQDVAITIGQTLFPILSELMEKITPVVYSIMEWVKQNPELVQQIALLVGGLVVLGPIIAAIGFAIETAGSLIKGLGTAITILTSGPIGLLIAAGAAIVYLFQDEIGAAIKDFAGWIQQENIFKAIGDTITETFGADSPILKAVGNFFFSIGTFFDNFQNNVKIYGSLIKLYAEYYFQGVVTAIQGVIDKMGDWIKKHPEIVTALTNLGIAVGIVAAALVGYNIVVGIVTTATALATGAVAALKGGIALMTGPIGLAVLAVWALVTAYQALRGAAEEAQKAAANVAPALANAIKGTNITLQDTKDALFRATVEEYTNQGLPPALADARARLVWGSGIINMDQAAKDAYDKAQAINSGRAGTGIAPIPPVGGGSAAKRDAGGYGMAMQPYAIGKSQLQNEIFIPGASGQFVNDFVDLMKSVAAGVTNNGGDTVIQVQMPAAALANPAGAYAAGQDFGRGLASEMRSQGVKGVR